MFRLATVRSYNAQNQLLQTQVTTNHYSWVQGPVLTSTNVATDYADTRTDTSYTTTYTNTGGGTLRQAVVADGRPRLVTFRTDSLGLVLKRDESLQSGAPHTDGDPHTMFYRFDGREIGAVGNDGDADEDYAASIAMRMSPAMGPYKNGAATQYARFGQVADAVTSFAQGSSAGTITAGSGDSLQAMALRLWGDASLWYKLAEINGLTNSSTIVSGQTLTVPGGIVRTANSASTLRPYDPSEALGDTSPTTPAPQAAGHKKGCGIVGSILIAVVAITVTVASSGAAVAVLTGNSFASGLSTVLGTSVLGGTVGGAATASIGTGALIAGGAVGGAFGSAASQGIGIAIGAQSRFSWGGVALGALSGAAGAGVGALGIGKVAGSPFLGNLVRGALGNALTQGVATATGLQSKFDWTGVAAAGLGAGVGGWVGGGRALSATASGIANAATRSLVNGTDFGDNIVAALPDVIAQTIGGFVEDAITTSANPYVDAASIGQIKVSTPDAWRQVDLSSAWLEQAASGELFSTPISLADGAAHAIRVQGVVEELYRREFGTSPGSYSASSRDVAGGRYLPVEERFTYSIAENRAWKADFLNAYPDTSDNRALYSDYGERLASFDAQDALLVRLNDQAERQVNGEFGGIVGSAVLGAATAGVGTLLFGGSLAGGLLTAGVSSAASGVPMRRAIGGRTTSSSLAFDATVGLATFGLARGGGAALNGLRGGVVAESEVLSPFTQRYLTTSGGRLGGTATREQLYGISQGYVKSGKYVEFNGGGLSSEEFIGGVGPGSKNGTYVDFTARAADGSAVRVQTIDTLANGITATPREAAAAARIRAAFPNDQLILIPKVKR